jgi:hypothetical protein
MARPPLATKEHPQRASTTGFPPVIESKVTLAPLVLPLVLFPFAAANLGYPRIATGGA